MWCGASTLRVQHSKSRGRTAATMASEAKGGSFGKPRDDVDEEEDLMEWEVRRSDGSFEREPS